jgi:DNA-binding response OmpR family regulator
MCQYRKKETCLLKNNLGLDISVPDINGLAVLREIKELKRKHPVLILSMR